MFTGSFHHTLSTVGADAEMKAVNIHPDLPLTELLGFGGAFTEAAAWNYAQMDAADRAEVIRRYFDRETGLGYRFCRLHIGSCDFSLSPYSLSYRPDLSDFSIERDRQYILPFVKDALKVSPDLFLFAAPWSPPVCMKEGDDLIGGGRLKEEFYPAYAQYFVKYLLAYREEGVRVSAVTVQNEPKAVQPWESCVFSATEEACFAVDHLRPALDAAGLGDVKIILWDHNKERLYERAAESMAYPGADRAVWGFGFHWYSGDHFGALDLVRRVFPNMPLLATELCHEVHNKTGEQRGFDYALEYCENLAHGAAGVCDWNMILQLSDGGPYHCRPTGGCSAALYYDTEKHRIVEDPILAPITVFARAFAPGDRLLAVTSFSSAIHAAAVQKPTGEIVAVLVNTGEPESVVLRVGGRVAKVDLPAASVTAHHLV